MGYVWGRERRQKRELRSGVLGRVVGHDPVVAERANITALTRCHRRIRPRQLMAPLNAPAFAQTQPSARDSTRQASAIFAVDRRVMGWRNAPRRSVCRLSHVAT